MDMSLGSGPSLSVTDLRCSVGIYISAEPTGGGDVVRGLEHVWGSEPSDLRFVEPELVLDKERGGLPGVLPEADRLEPRLLERDLSAVCFFLSPGRGQINSSPRPASCHCLSRALPDSADCFR